MDEEEWVPVRVGSRTVQCRRGRKLFDELINANVVVRTACGGNGTCFLCRVIVTDGLPHLNAPTEPEIRGLGNVLLHVSQRLSCQVIVDRPLAVDIPFRESSSERRRRILAVRRLKSEKKRE